MDDLSYMRVVVTYVQDMWEEETLCIYIIIAWGNVLDGVPSDYISSDLKVVICNKSKIEFLRYYSEL